MKLSADGTVGTIQKDKVDDRKNGKNIDSPQVAVNPTNRFTLSNTIHLCAKRYVTKRSRNGTKIIHARVFFQIHAVSLLVESVSDTNTIAVISETSPAEKQAMIGCRKQRDESAPTEKQQQTIRHQTKSNSTDKLLQYFGTPFGNTKNGPMERSSDVKRHSSSKHHGTANLDVTMAMGLTPLSAKNRNRPLA
jgi:hypothetical protein